MNDKKRILNEIIVICPNPLRGVRKHPRTKGNISLFCSNFRINDISSISTNTTQSQDHENRSTHVASNEPIYDPRTSQIPPPPAGRITLDQYRSRRNVPRPPVQRLGTYPSRPIGGTSVSHYPSRTEYDTPTVVKPRNFFEELNSFTNARQATSSKYSLLFLLLIQEFRKWNIKSHLLLKEQRVLV